MGLLDGIKLERCKAHDSPGCVECRMDRARQAGEAQASALLAMHHLMVWMLCEGCTGLGETMCKAFTKGWVSALEAPK